MICICRNYSVSPLLLLLAPQFQTSKTLIIIRRRFLKPSMEISSIPKSQNDETAPIPMSKNAQKRLLKQQRYELKKAEAKARMKEHKKNEAARKRKEWEDKLESLGTEEEREKLREEKIGIRKERMNKRNEEKEKKLEKLRGAKVNGQNVVVDLEFSNLMTETELHSLVQQIMYCYAMNARSDTPAHLWLTGCQGVMQEQLQRIGGYDKWMIEKESRSYIEALADQKENLVYLTADSENVLEELDPKAYYIIGGLVDRNRFKSITMNKATQQGIKTAKLPIGTYLKMSSSQVLTVNQVMEILLKFVETKDWKDSFFQVIPQRKRCEAGSKDNEHDSEKKGVCEEADETKPGEQDDDSEKKGVCEEEDETKPGEQDDDSEKKGVCEEENETKPGEQDDDSEKKGVCEEEDQTKPGEQDDADNLEEDDDLKIQDQKVKRQCIGV